MKPDMNNMTINHSSETVKEMQGRRLGDGSEMARRWLGDAREMARRCQAPGRLLSMLGVWLEHGWSMGRACLETLLVRRLRTLSPTPSDSQSDAFGLHSLRYAACLMLLMVLGVSETWGQDSYDGIWYINNQRLPNDGYLLSPIFTSGDGVSCNWVF